MTERNEQRHFVATQLAALIVGATQSKPAKIEIANAVCVVDNIVDYGIGVAQDLADQALKNTAADKLTAHVLKKHAETAPAPEER